METRERSRRVCEEVRGREKRSFKELCPDHHPI